MANHPCSRIDGEPVDGSSVIVRVARRGGVPAGVRHLADDVLGAQRDRFDERLGLEATHVGMKRSLAAPPEGA